MADEPTPAQTPEADVDEGQAALDVLTGKTPADEPKPEATEPAKAEPEKQDEPEAPAPGTPDKALQKVQQDLSAANRKLEELSAKLDRGESLSDRDQKQLARARRTIDELAEQKDLDLIGDESAGKKLVKAVVETDSELAELRRDVAQLREQQAWEREQAKYPGVDIRAVWGKALADAQGYEKFGPAAYQQRAYDLFTERCTAATASVAAKQNKAADAAKPPANRPATPPVTPGGGKLAVSAAEARGGVEPQSDEDAYASFVMRALGVKE